MPGSARNAMTARVKIWCEPFRLDQTEPRSRFGLYESLDRATAQCLDVTEELLLVARRDH